MQRNRLLGYRIASEEMQGEERAEYGTELIKNLSKKLTQSYEKLFASKYKLYLPTEEELKVEIDTQKAMFYLQQQSSKEDKINK